MSSGGFDTFIESLTVSGTVSKSVSYSISSKSNVSNSMIGGSSYTNIYIQSAYPIDTEYITMDLSASTDILSSITSFETITYSASPSYSWTSASGNFTFTVRGSSDSGTISATSQSSNTSYTQLFGGSGGTTSVTAPSPLIYRVDGNKLYIEGFTMSCYPSLIGYVGLNMSGYSLTTGDGTLDITDFTATIKYSCTIKFTLSNVFGYA